MGGPTDVRWASSAEVVLTQLLAGDQEALRVIVKRFSPILLAFARRIVAEPSLAEEVAQDTFMALWRLPGAFDPKRGTLQAFLLGVARNKAIDIVRREARARRTAESLLAEAEATSTATVGDEVMEEVDTRHAVHSALARLSALQRQAIVLAYFGGRTYREVASELRIPEGTAKSRLRDGLMRLRAEMAVKQDRHDARNQCEPLPEVATQLTSDGPRRLR